jgi:putative transposase
MRISRFLQLQAECAFHFMWRCINGEHFMQDESRKVLFLNSFFRFMSRSRNQVLLYSFCVMSNHFHMAAELLKDSRYISWWARSGLSSFALKLNRILGRRGPVGQDRPKTVVVEDSEALMRLMFYHDWNPVEAGLATHPSRYPFSSYRFYAYGEVNEWTKRITPPQWYLDLADTPEERQRLYRKLCDLYWSEKQARLREEEADDGWGIGSDRFMWNRNRLMRAIGNHQRRGKRGKIPRRDLKRMALRLVVPGATAASPVPRPGRPTQPVLATG